MTYYLLGCGHHMRFLSLILARHVLETGGAREVRRFSVVQQKVETDVTFIRHGESAGNLAQRSKLAFLREYIGSARYAWKDGQLTREGEADAVTSVEELKPELLARITGSQLVLVSPLQRAMATCMLVLATAYKRQGLDPQHLGPGGPEGHTVIVREELREKVGSESDMPGKNPVSQWEYLGKLASRYGTAFFNDSHALDNFVVAVRGTYESQEGRTANWGRGWDSASQQGGNETTERGTAQQRRGPVPISPEQLQQQQEPNDGGRLLQQIQRFRTYLARFPTTPVLIVGHNGWARSTFCAGLLEPCEAKEKVGTMTMSTFGTRMVQPVDNLGMVSAKFKNGMFFSVQVHSDGGGARCTKPKIGLISSVREMKAEGLLPPDVLMHRVMVKKHQDSGGFDKRLITFSSTANIPRMAWGSRFGNPKKFISLAGGTMQHQVAARQPDSDPGVDIFGTTENGGMLISTTHAGAKDVVRPFELRVESWENYYRLLNLLELYSRYGTNTSFLSSLLSSKGWHATGANFGSGFGGIPDDRLILEELAQWDEEFQFWHPTTTTTTTTTTFDWCIQNPTMCGHIIIHR
ncbi:unnamed protein product [Prorocentrum cordatum]|uniref:Uncharacterized protein n=2 Tax=Prorocentrum cordatum TaxID=2364126 RepID=A0ABN9PBX2_9DINO|nr:unnamed protein product [Polarella glacialis]